MAMGSLQLDQVSLWTLDDVKTWLEESDFGEYVNLLCYTHRIDGKALLTLSENDLKSPPLSMHVSNVICGIESFYLLILVRFFPSISYIIVI